MRTFPKSIAIVMAALTFVATSTLPSFAEHAQMVMAGDIKIENAWTRATPNGAKAGGAFLLITNTGAEADRLMRHHLMWRQKLKFTK